MDLSFRNDLIQEDPNISGVNNISVGNFSKSTRILDAGRSQKNQDNSNADHTGVLNSKKQSVSSGHISTSSQISFVECSPFLESSRLFAYGSDSYISIIQLTNEEANPSTRAIVTDSESLSWNFAHVLDIQSYGKGGSPTAFTWNRRSQSVPEQDTLISFATSNTDKRIHYFQKNVSSGETSAEILSGHTDSINSCSFSYTQDNIIASTSDDQTCRVWDIEAEQEISLLRLRSPGVSVKWHRHPSYHNLFMVAEQNGNIRLYDLRSGTPVTSIYINGVLVDADWSPADPLRIGAVTQSEWSVHTMGSSVEGGFQKTDVKRSSLAHVLDGSSRIRWSFVNRNLFATSASTSATISLVDVTHHQIPYVAARKAAPRVSGISWLYNLPCCVAGFYKSLEFFFAGSSVSSGTASVNVDNEPNFRGVY